jgi:hypothetical protein
MLPQQPDRAGEANLHAAVDECVLEPLRALEAVVHQLAMVAERVTEQQHDHSAEDE